MSKVPTQEVVRSTNRVTEQMFADVKMAEKNKQAAREQLLRIQLILALRPIK